MAPEDDPMMDIEPYSELGPDTVRDNGEVIAAPSDKLTPFEREALRIEEAIAAADANVEAIRCDLKDAKKIRDDLIASLREHARTARQPTMF